MNVFLRNLSKEYPNDIIMLCCDGAAWHKSGVLEIPENIELFHILPYTPEMNPIEQFWKESRKRGSRNEIFASLTKVMDRLCDTITTLTKHTVSSITGSEWILKCFKQNRQRQSTVKMNGAYAPPLTSAARPAFVAIKGATD